MSASGSKGRLDPTVGGRTSPRRDGAAAGPARSEALLPLGAPSDAGSRRSTVTLSRARSGLEVAGVEPAPAGLVGVQARRGRQLRARLKASPNASATWTRAVFLSSPATRTQGALSVLVRATISSTAAS